ncbi:c-type cytochrome domain-containing protein [Flavivirga algicola]|uniref:Cytochrome c domain-containing protein n=1 Tax=Flavivirga algicola TaxID=2729136 RepID=A0ABX1RVF5_9FLAO|nr:c-type cytochrome domain-containing protein [Flavivirga algicola]NMH87536.1 hypothetical protein [Flavivirga algicola]
MEASNQVSEFVIFIGRFHPLIVHLPIGILLIGILMHFLAKKKRFQYLDKAVSFTLAIGSISAILSCFLGYLLSFQGGYDADALFNHQWLGIAVGCFSLLAYSTRVWKKTRKSFVLNSIAMGILFIGLGLTGHLGGNLTHGSAYLTQYAPEPIRKIIGLAPKPKKRPPIMVLDSADIFLDVINPMVSNKCISCHNLEKTKGGLLLTSHASMLEGGENGPAIVAEDLQKSELFKRITLPEHHEDFMPPEGKKPFSEDDIKLIEFWILNGARPTGLLADIELDEDNTKLFENFLGLKDSQNNPLLADAEAGDSLVIRSLRSKGFKIESLSNESNLLDVSLSPNNIKGLESIEELLLLKDQIVHLKLSSLGLKDNNLKVIGQLNHLIRLNLHSNPITDSGISFLSELQNLESLNLYGTQIENKSLELLSTLKNLKRLYVWNTKVTKAKVEAFKNSRTDLDIIFGLALFIVKE